MVQISQAVTEIYRPTMYTPN